MDDGTPGAPGIGVPPDRDPEAEDSEGAPRSEHWPHPVLLRVDPATEGRNRLTTAFRLILAFPHLLLVGAPPVVTLSWLWSSDGGWSPGLGAGGGVLGAVAGVVAVVSWFSILFTGSTPQGLRDLVAFYLRWRVRAVAYTALLRDEYPPFGDGAYPVTLELPATEPPRKRLAVALRIFLILPHFLLLWALGIVWALTSLLAWCAILLIGSYPRALYDFAVGVLRWTIRVEAYLLLLHDEYPPFSLS